jgi:hypothetical protein
VGFMQHVIIELTTKGSTLTTKSMHHSKPAPSYCVLGWLILHTIKRYGLLRIEFGGRETNFRNALVCVCERIDLVT